MPTPRKPNTTTNPAASKKSAALDVGGSGGKSAVSTNIKKKSRRFTTQEIVEALLKKGGIVSSAADLIGCDRDTIYKRRDEPEIADAINRGRYYAVDEAENALQSQVKDKDTTAIIFTLKTLGKSRGYIERQEFTGADGKPMETKTVIEVRYVNPNSNS